MAYPIIVIGGGGHASVVIDVLRLRQATVVGLLTRDRDAEAGEMFGVKVLGDDAAISSYSPAEVRLVNAVGSARSMSERRRVFEKFKALGFAFAQVIHPGSIVAQDVVLGEGTQIMAGAVVQPGCRLGDNCIVNTKASVDHDCVLGSHVHVAPGCTLSGSVTVGDESHLGTGATIVQGVSIGKGVLVAAGAVVVGPVEDCTCVGGVPARRMENNA